MPAKTRRMSRAIMAGKMSNMEKRLRAVRRAAWKQNDLKAGMGIKAAERKAARIRVKAAQLSDSDLLEVVRMRQKKIEVRGARSEGESAP